MPTPGKWAVDRFEQAVIEAAILYATDPELMENQGRVIRAVDDLIQHSDAAVTETDKNVIIGRAYVHRVLHALAHLAP